MDDLPNPTDADLLDAYRARELLPWYELIEARAKYDNVPTFRARNAIKKLANAADGTPYAWKGRYLALLRRLTEVSETLLGQDALDVEVELLVKVHNELYTQWNDD
jgi:hypothetical protein